MSRNGPSLGLFTDLYQLTMAQAYWQNSQTARATFSLFFRKYPPNRGYFVFAGLDDVVDYLEEFRFSRDDIDYLRSTHRYTDDFLEYLGELRFTGDVRAMSEGTPFFINEPVLELTAPVIEAQLVETMLVNQTTLQSVLATKASRVVHVARGKTVVDFAARRTHGTEAANKLSRVSYMAGFAGTSNVLGGALYSIPTFGTMAHSFVTTFEDEADSFRAYARVFPDASTFLVDTYDTLEGVRRAIEVGLEMKALGHSLRAIRLDSGDLLDLSLQSRAMLDDAGLGDVEIIATGGLDEFEVDSLLAAGAPIDGFGVGTKVGVSADAPWTDGVYKLVEYDGRPVVKLSAGKATLPGPKQVYRYRDESDVYIRDVVAGADELPPGGSAEPLIHEVMKKGRRLGPLPGLDELRTRFWSGLDRLPDRHKAIRSPAEYEVVVSDRLRALATKLTHEATTRHADAPTVDRR